MINRDEVLQRAKLEVTQVDDVPGWGTIYLRPYPEVVRIQRVSQGENPRWRAQRIIDLLVDESGEPIFEADDLIAVSELDSYKLDPLAAAIQVFLSEHQKKSEIESTDFAGSLETVPS